MSDYTAKDLYSQLDAMGLLKHGSYIHGAIVREILGIQLPEIGPKKLFDDAALKELGSIGYVKNLLLDQGMYLAKDGDGYKIPLPSQNIDFIRNYVKSADRKLKRALKLSKSSPIQDHEYDKTKVRIMMKQESNKRAFA